MVLKYYMVLEYLLHEVDCLANNLLSFSNSLRLDSSDDFTTLLESIFSKCNAAYAL